MALWQPTNTESSGVTSGATESLWCEILPITLQAGQIVYIQRGQDTATAWHKPYNSSSHPSDVVRANCAWPT